MYMFNVVQLKVHYFPRNAKYKYHSVAKLHSG